MSHPKDQQLTHSTVVGKDFVSFDYQEYGLQGVGKDHRPLVNMDQYIDHSTDLALHQECCIGLATVDNYKMGTFIGDIPPFEKQRTGKECWSEILQDVNKFDPTSIHQQAIKEILQRTGYGVEGMKATYRYMYFNMNAFIPWFFTVYLKKSSFQDKTANSGWLPESDHFPKLKQYIETLPFESIGRVLFFTSMPNTPITAHRDHPVAEHKDHNINLFFSSGPRKSYVWDELKDEKVYLPDNCRSYFFNNRDYHGVDADPKFRYTLRVDGTFTRELQEELGLEDGYTFKWDY